MARLTKHPSLVGQDALSSGMNLPVLIQDFNSHRVTNLVLHANADSASSLQASGLHRHTAPSHQERGRHRTSQPFEQPNASVSSSCFSLAVSHFLDRPKSINRNSARAWPAARAGSLSVSPTGPGSCANLAVRGAGAILFVCWVDANDMSVLVIFRALDLILDCKFYSQGIGAPIFMYSKRRLYPTAQQLLMV